MRLRSRLNVCRENLCVVCGEKEWFFKYVRDFYVKVEITLLKSGWNGQSVRRDVLEQEKCCLRTGKVARVGNRRVVCETGRICLKRGKVLPEKWIACDLNKNFAGNWWVGGVIGRWVVLNEREVLVFRK